MIFPMAGQVTLTMVAGQVNKFEKAARTAGNYSGFKIDEVCVAGTITLCQTDAVRIMACITWSPHIRLKVLIMFFKGNIT